jgi:(E)-4-hydroxy-3-methylbut-2-enyl-diphosphate synthase
LLVPATTPSDLASLCEVLATIPLATEFLALELSPALTPDILQPLLAMSRGRLMLVRSFGSEEAETLATFTKLVRQHGHFLAAEIAPDDFSALSSTLRTVGPDRLVFTLSGFRPAHRSEGGSPVSGTGHALGAFRRLADELCRLDLRAPVWIRNTADTAVQGENSFLSRLLEASFLTGGLLCDGIGDLVSIETESDPARAVRLAYNVLQGAGARISKTEFVACPSCGRTLFDLQTTTQRIRAQTEHLKGVKLAIMGCIVNGPGEMADADFGYVGGAPGKINLYVGKTCVQYNIPAAEADARLIALIKEHGKWIEPKAAPSATETAGRPS